MFRNHKEKLSGEKFKKNNKKIKNKKKARSDSKSSSDYESKEGKSHICLIANYEKESDEVTLEYLNSCPKKVLVNALHTMIKNVKTSSSKIISIDMISNHENNVKA